LSAQPPPQLRAGLIRGVAFDLDGTLVDSYAAIAESLNHARSLRALEPLPLELVRRQVGHGLERLVAEWVTADDVEAGVQDFRQRYAQVFAELTHVLPGVPATLERLAARDVRMCVASNKPARFGRPILESLGLLSFFDAVLGPDVAGATKPHPAMLLQGMARMGSAPDTTVYVGDMVLDVETAARAGVPVVLVCGGSSDSKQLRATGQQVLERFDELAALLSPDTR
jgi:phosphoglycolate phosphatase